ncbi:MAG: Mrp/NBP35 family ATP-binding protein [Anaerolineales bacterium]
MLKESSQRTYRWKTFEREKDDRTTEAGSRVGLLDADIYGPNVPMMMGVGQMPEPEGDKLVPAQSFGIKVMSIGFLVPSGQPLIWRGPMLHSAIRQFVADVAWGELDYLIVDLPPGTGDAQLSLAQTMTLSGGLIVTLPQQVSLEDARRGLEMFRSMNVPVLGVVENMSFLELPDGTRMDIFGEGGGKRLAEASGVPFLGQIPMDPEVRKGGDEGKPIVISNRESPAAKSFQKLVKNLEQAIPGESPDQPGQIKIEITD